MEFIFAWLVFGAAAGAVAKGKNRSIPLWVVIGLLLGPLAILIVALMKTAPGPEQDYN
jgi:uncharacterized membrane protein YeaQ/YmgE (transglycosylase-associated protein family)